MNLEFEQSLDTLCHLLSSCVDSWRMGYDAGGYKNFVKSIEQLELILLKYFDQVQDSAEPLSMILSRLERFIQHKDIMAIQDVVEYVWLPLSLEWKKGAIT